MTRICDVESWVERVPLACPYTIATAHIDAVSLAFVRLIADAFWKAGEYD